MNGYVIDYLNENEFKKLERALKKYNFKAFKKLNFDYYPALRNGHFLGELVSTNKKEGTWKYELTLPSDKMFAAVHGDVKLFYTVYKKERTVMLDTITPTEILLEGHMSELTTYKGIMISKANASKDKFKIDLLNMLQGNESTYVPTIPASSHKANTSKKNNCLKSLQTKKHNLNDEIDDLEIKKHNLMDDITELEAKKKKIEKNLNLSSLDEKTMNTDKVSRDAEQNISNKSNENDNSFITIFGISIVIFAIIYILTNL